MYIDSEKTSALRLYSIFTKTIRADHYSDLDHGTWKSSIHLCDTSKSFAMGHLILLNQPLAGAKDARFIPTVCPNRSKPETTCANESISAADLTSRCSRRLCSRSRRVPLCPRLLLSIVPVSLSFTFVFRSPPSSLKAVPKTLSLSGYPGGTALASLHSMLLLRFLLPTSSFRQSCFLLFVREVDSGGD